MKFNAFMAVLMTVAALALSAGAADAADKRNAVVAPMSDADRAYLRKVETYLDSIRTMQSAFLQSSSNGEQTQGMLYLSRPGKLRITYDPPSPVVILANQKYLSYIDTELKQITHLPIDDTPASFLLADKFSFTSGTVSVTDFQRTPGATRVTLVQRKDPLAGRLTLVMADSPMVLRKWTVVDAQGTVTDVTLLNPRFDFPIPEKIFDFDTQSLAPAGN